MMVQTKGFCELFASGFERLGATRMGGDSQRKKGTGWQNMAWSPSYF